MLRGFESTLVHALQLVQHILALSHQMEECQFESVCQHRQLHILSFVLACHDATHSRFRCV